MRYVVERTLNISTIDNLASSYWFFKNVFNTLISDIKCEVGHAFTVDQYNNLYFFMNYALYEKFNTVCRTSGHVSDMYKGIRIILDPSWHVISPQDGLVRLVYKELNPYYRQYSIDDVEATHELYYSSARKGGTTHFLYEFLGLDRGHGFQRVPHIDHVKFNGPATIVFWKDGTKTVVKYDGKGRKDRRMAVLYAFMRKIYGEGKPYHNILNEIEEAIK